jgi:hypothetical protein
MLEIYKKEAQGFITQQSCSHFYGFKARFQRSMLDSPDEYAGWFMGISRL